MSFITVSSAARNRCCTSGASHFLAEPLAEPNLGLKKPDQESTILIQAWILSVTIINTEIPRFEMFSATRFSTITCRSLAHRLTEVSYREQHSSTQIKRLFKKNPARFRVAKRQGWIPEPQPIPEPKYSLITEPVVLPNGWSVPVGPEVVVPKYPFQVLRTKNKPHDAVGFLPVYSEFR